MTMLTKSIVSVKNMWFRLDDRTKFIITLTGSLIILLIIASTSWLIYDVGYFIKWDEVFRKKGLLYIYAYSSPCPEYKVAYPPMAVLLFIFFYELGLMFSDASLVLLRLIVKIPLIISFIMIAYYLYRYYGWNTSKWFLVTIAAYGTVLSYQFDLVVALGLMASFILLYKKKSLFLSGMVFTFAILIKPLPAVLAPLYMYDSYKIKKIRGVAEFLLGCIAIGIPIVMPFLYFSPENFIAHVITFHSNRIPQELSLYALPLYLAHYDYRVLPDFLKWIWVPVFVVVYLYVINTLIRNKGVDEKCGSLAYATVLLITLALNKVGNNPYFVWVLPFLAINIGNIVTKLRAKIVYLMIPMVSMAFYGFLTFVTAGVVRGYIFLAEDLAWYDAYELLVNSFKDAPFLDIRRLLDYLYANYYIVFYVLYKYMWLSMIILSLLYVSMLLYLSYEFMREYKEMCCTGKSLFRELIDLARLLKNSVLKAITTLRLALKNFFERFP
ncbi:DUF2029 domain-containing protein [Desulfurococcaceae archaeon MEX13E-LK6-19]|nr:DUF2029 domain-containing protein [Desulfurococcaceae archaeon MEX13E-LK6-19]